ncbi:hypothetical protein ACFWY6_26795 [Streptomyces sp. NPDC059037]|uniref:hypothetical protein n=1 Tax=Streptomyces sp. NPDC059037 TaxID=3346710 RepID=UPI0036847749
MNEPAKALTRRGRFTEHPTAAAQAVNPPADTSGNTHYRKHPVRTCVPHVCEEATSR